MKKTLANTVTDPSNGQPFMIPTAARAAMWIQSVGSISGGHGGNSAARSAKFFKPIARSTSGGHRANSRARDTQFFCIGRQRKRCRACGVGYSAPTLAPDVGKHVYSFTVFGPLSYRLQTEAATNWSSHRSRCPQTKTATDRNVYKLKQPPKLEWPHHITS